MTPCVQPHYLRARHSLASLADIYPHNIYMPGNFRFRSARLPIVHLHLLFGFIAYNFFSNGALASVDLDGA